MEYCPHCMRPAAGEICPHCGKPLKWAGQAGVDLPVGTVLTGSNGLRTYQLGVALGKGGFGITYVALEVNSHRRMAVKEYFPIYCAFRSGNARDVQVMTGKEQIYQKGLNSFLEEAKMLLSQDDLATLVKVVDFFQANGTAYLVMEFIDGVPLHRKMAELGGRFPPEVLLPALPPLLADLGTLHARGVIHRDISPDNILWTPDGTLKLIDFGSARATGNGSGMTTLMKQGFSPIEQYTRRGQGSWTDVYALAATVYYCLTGVTPPASVERLEQDPLQPPTSLGAQVTQGQEQALLHAMAVQPGDRTRTMEDFAQKLFQEEQPVWETPPKQEAPKQDAPKAAVPDGEGPAKSPAIHQLWQEKVIPQILRVPPKKRALIGGIALAVVALIIAVVLWPRQAPQPTIQEPPTGTTASQVPARRPTLPTLDDPTPTETSAPPSETAAQPPETTQSGERTVTNSDGFVFRIENDQNASIVGYTGTDRIGVLPESINGIPVTAIEDGAFAGVKAWGRVLLPDTLETIGSNAFAQCRDLRMLEVFSDVRCGKDAFANSDIHLVWVYDSTCGTSGWDLPDDVRLYQRDKDNGFGKWKECDNLEDGTFYLLTENTTAVVVLLSGTEDNIELPNSVEYASTFYEFVWIAEGADAGVCPGTTVALPPNCRFDFSLCKSQGGGVTAFNALYDDTLADFWIATCAFCEAINNARPRGAPAILPDPVLCDAANILSQEEYSGSSRPNGKNWSTAIKEAGLQTWSFAQLYYGYGTFSEMKDDVVEKYAHAINDSSVSEIQGQYYTYMGVAKWHDFSSGSYCWEIILLVP